jgi:hypothetical protein
MGDMKNIITIRQTFHSSLMQQITDIEILISVLEDQARIKYESKIREKYGVNEIINVVPQTYQRDRA